MGNRSTTKPPSSSSLHLLPLPTRCFNTQSWWKLEELELIPCTQLKRDKNPTAAYCYLLLLYSEVARPPNPKPQAWCATKLTPLLFPKQIHTLLHSWEPRLHFWLTHLQAIVLIASSKLGLSHLSLWNLSFFTFLIVIFIFCIFSLFLACFTSMKKYFLNTQCQSVHDIILIFTWQIINVVQIVQLPKTQISWNACLKGNFLHLEQPVATLSLAKVCKKKGCYFLSMTQGVIGIIISPYFVPWSCSHKEGRTNWKVVLHKEPPSIRHVLDTYLISFPKVPCLQWTEWLVGISSTISWHGSTNPSLEPLFYIRDAWQSYL
jgi:hypothetical protein